MSLSELNTLLDSIPGFKDKVTYRAWQIGQAPALPYICYLSNGSDNILADDKVYKKRLRVDIELYSALKDIASEEAIEDALDANDIPWEKDEEYIDSENCYQVTYEVTI